MNILNFIKFEKYYCQISTSLQNKLKKKVSNYSDYACKLAISYTTISRILNQNNYWMNFQLLLRLAKLLNIKKEDVFSSVKFIKTHNSFPIKFNRKKLTSPSFFRVIGHILGDGGIHVIKNEGKYRAFYVNNEKILLNSFLKDVRIVFGNFKVYFRKRSEHGDEIWLPTTIGYLFYEILAYENNKVKRIPSFVYETQNSELTGALLQAIYDDDGYLYPQKNMIVISQKNRLLVNDIRNLVKRIGIKPNKILIHNAKNRTRMYYFSITNKENITKFNKEIGFLHPMKKKKLKLLTSKYKVF